MHESVRVIEKDAGVLDMRCVVFFSCTGSGSLEKRNKSPATVIALTVFGKSRFDASLCVLLKPPSSLVRVLALSLY